MSDNATTYPLKQSSAGNVTGLTHMSFRGGASLQGFSLLAVTNLLTLDFPNLQQIDEAEAFSGGLVASGLTALTRFTAPQLIHVAGDIDLHGNTSLTSIALPSLVDVGGKIDVHSCTEITSLDLSALTTVDSASGIDAHGCTLLASVNLAAFVPKNGATYNFNACALSAAQVNAILARAVASAGYVSGTINVAGGTNAAPTGQGATDVTTLTGRGVTVTHT